MELAAFKENKILLYFELLPQHVNQDKPFVLRVDASRYAVGANLEQLIDEDRRPNEEDVLNKKLLLWHSCPENLLRVSESGSQGSKKPMP